MITQYVRIQLMSSILSCFDETDPSTKRINITPQIFNLSLWYCFTHISFYIFFFIEKKLRTTGPDH